MLPLRSDSPSTASLYASPLVAIDSILLLFALLNNTQLLVTLLGWRLNNKDAINGGAISALCAGADDGAATAGSSARP